MNSLELVAGMVVPVLALGFVTAIALVNLFLSVRKRFPVRVNCWFCNTNTSVPYDSGNSWNCPSCTQYNGFTEDGDYNREIPEQYQAARNGPRRNATDDDKIIGHARRPAAQNGLCFGCNRNQELKIHQLASFVPEVEENYDGEVEEYQRQLEQAYKLCGRCERVVKRTLNDVKRNILGSKLAQIGSRGLKVLDLHMEVNGKREAAFRKRKTVASVCLGVIVVLLGMRLGERAMQVEMTRERLEAVLGSMVASCALIVVSYVVAMRDTLGDRWNATLKHPVVADGLDQLESVGSLIKGKLTSYRKAEVPDSLVEEMLVASAKVEELFDGQQSALSNLALISLAGMLLAVRSRVPKVKLIVLIACGALEMILRTEAGAALLLAKGTTIAAVELFLSSIGLLTALTCIGQTTPRIDATDSVNSSFHKIYSQQEGDESMAQSDLDETSPIPQESSRHSIRSADTTKSISPSVLTASTMRPFLELDSFATSPRSHFGGSMASVYRHDSSLVQPPAPSFASRQSGFGSLLKAPSASVDNFTTTTFPGGTSSSRLAGFSLNAINASTQLHLLAEDDDREPFGDDIDRLSISGRTSTTRRKDFVNNPFATHHVDALNESFCSPSAESWIAGGYWQSPTKEPAPFMSRTSSQSSGFESAPVTRRHTPEEPPGGAGMPAIDLDRISLFSEPCFGGNASSVSQQQRLNQTLTFPIVPPPSPRRNLFGERGLFESGRSGSTFERSSSFFPVSGMASRSHLNLGGNGWQSLGQVTPVASPGGGGHRRSLLNLSKLGEGRPLPSQH
uniref:Ima1 N-terminal domain-containing protein n=1 Tax=Culex tarsalis TaxID=7177 RepID=A0A1Q3EVK1_CULTA